MKISDEELAIVSVKNHKQASRKSKRVIKKKHTQWRML